ncbi:hypothetical protein [Streptomyces sp. NPDC051561]|uniref:hypothetical protein n=1 Tax=Streptomyces sp. NPDC051561 TaxID=3365658 RepID=UPI0037B9D72D
MPEVRLGERRTAKTSLKCEHYSRQCCWHATTAAHSVDRVRRHAGKVQRQSHQWSVWEHRSPLFQMIGGLELPVQPVANRLRLHVERSWDGLDDLDVVLFLLRGFSFAVSKHGGNPAGVSLVRLTQPHVDADKVLDALLEVLGVSEEIVAFRGDFRDTPSERTTEGR